MLQRSSGSPWKIADFGITSLGYIYITQKGRGTGIYRSPEILPSVESPNPTIGRFDHKADIWALGCVSFELFTQEKPFLSDLWVLKHVERPDHLYSARINPLLLPSLRGPLRSMLSPSPENRPTAASLLHVWEDIQQKYQPGQEQWVPEPRPSQTPDASSRTSAEILECEKCRSRGQQV